MRLKVILGALALAAASAAPAQAQTEDAAPAVPTVTIINKSAAPAEPAVAELDIEPVAPADPAAPAPGTPAAPAAPAGTTTAPPEVAAKPENAAAAAAAVVVAPEPPREPTLAIDIDLSRQVMTVSAGGARLHAWPISSAAYGYRTPTGTFKPTWMSKMWYSRQYDNAPMPHSIFFHKGVAIHATYAIRSLGRPASHGCVRLAPKNAAALFKLVTRHGKDNTEIVVRGRPEHSSPKVASNERIGRTRRGTAQRYLPPNYASYSAPPSVYYAPPRQRQLRAYAPPRAQPRGFFSY